MGLAAKVHAGMMEGEHASLAGAFLYGTDTLDGRLALEVLGGDGTLLNEHVGRFVPDAETIYSYEGTREINTLLVGRGITGLGAFV